MRVVSNTSPISNLAIVGLLDLLRERYGRVAIPFAVRTELLSLTHPAGRAAVETALRDGWLITEALSVQTIADELRGELDPGEAEAIALAVATSADVLLLDERRARQAARQRGIAVAGVLGELLHAKASGRISSVSIEMGRLKSEARFFIRSDLEAFFRKEAGE